MFQLIERLQQKSESERRKIHWALTIGITLVIAALWFFIQFGQVGSNRAAVRESDSPIDAAASMLSEVLFEGADLMNSVIDSVVNWRDEAL